MVNIEIIMKRKNLRYTIIEYVLFRNLYAEVENGSESQKLYSAIVQLQNNGPFSANGYFIVEKSTLIGMLSTLLTYIIILIQSTT